MQFTETSTIVYSDLQQQFINLLMQGKNIFLTGKAGTGKSYITRVGMQMLADAGMQVAAVAPTGVAANNIGGSTIHSMFSIQPFGILEESLCKHLKAGGAAV